MCYIKGYANKFIVLFPLILWSYLISLVSICIEMKLSLTCNTFKTRSNIISNYESSTFNKSVTIFGNLLI